MAVNEQPEVSFSIPQGTMPLVQILFARLYYRVEFSLQRDMCMRRVFGAVLGLEVKSLLASLLHGPCREYSSVFFIRSIPI